MNPQQYFGFPSIHMRQDRGPSTTDPASSLPWLGDIQAALSLRDEQANLNHLFNQPMRQRNLGLPTGLPAIDIASLQRTLAIEEGNRRRLSLQAQLDLLSRTNVGFASATRAQSLELPGVYPKSIIGTGTQARRTIQESIILNNKRRKLSVDTLENSKPPAAKAAAETDLQGIHNELSPVTKQMFPLPPRRDGGDCPLRDRLAAFRIAWESLNKTCKCDKGLTERERELLVKDMFGKTIQLDKVLLYCTSHARDQ